MRKVTYGLLAIVLTIVLIFSSGTKTQASYVVNGTYYIAGYNEMGKNLNVSVYNVNEIQNFKRINIYDAPPAGVCDPTQMFSIIADGNGYMIYLGKPGYTLNVMSRNAGAEAIAYQDNPANNERWLIIDGEWMGTRIVLESNQCLCLAADPSTGKVTLQNIKMYDNNQYWYFIK